MRRCFALGLVLGILLLAGCATQPRATKWEYKVAYLGTVSAGDPKIWVGEYQTFLDNFGKEGWILVSQDSGKVFYFKRPVR